ncbi:MAG: hypothetical protein LH631_10485 [Alkalinema sp. CAN_BIN05]|nr:hypothetical protein [Alkalinema sp. CAN_BIN05]
MALGRSETIDLTQAKYAIDPADWQNTFNLALYHLAAGDQQEFDMLYCSGLNAPQEMIEMAVRDLEDLREWRIENDELRIGEMIERLKVGRTIGNTIAL